MDDEAKRKFLEGAHQQKTEAYLSLISQYPGIENPDQLRALQQLVPDNEHNAMQAALRVPDILQLRQGEVLAVVDERAKEILRAVQILKAQGMLVSNQMPESPFIRWVIKHDIPLNSAVAEEGIHLTLTDYGPGQEVSILQNYKLLQGNRFRPESEVVFRSLNQTSGSGESMGKPVSVIYVPDQTVSSGRHTILRNYTAQSYLEQGDCILNRIEIILASRNSKEEGAVVLYYIITTNEGQQIPIRIHQLPRNTLDNPASINWLWKVDVLDNSGNMIGHSIVADNDGANALQRQQELDIQNHRLRLECIERVLKIQMLKDQGTGYRSVAETVVPYRADLHATEALYAATEDLLLCLKPT